jgi:hypothetical protein
MSLKNLYGKWIAQIAIGIGASLAASMAHAACDSDLSERLTRAQLTPAQMEIVCGKPAPDTAIAEPAPQADAESAAEATASAAPETDAPLPDLTPEPIFVTPERKPHPMLENHYPTSVGWTSDSDDVPYIEANLSMRYPLGYREIAKGGCNPWHMQPYFAFTGRFGQYLLSRESSPVVQKAFNPEFFLRFFMDSAMPFFNDPSVSMNDICEKEGDLVYHNDRLMASRTETSAAPISPSHLGFIDVYYGHLSNGQSVTDLTTLTTLASTLGGTPAQNMEYAKDYVSRGWDYFGAAWTGTFQNGSSLYVRARKYIDGVLQAHIEETPWEDPTSRITRLQQVNGLYTRYTTSNSGAIAHYVFSWETGLETPGRYNTFRLEAISRVKWLGVPLKLWYQRGYNSDLAQYYKFVESYGVAFQFTTFNDR